MKQKNSAPGERPANLLFWFRNGFCGRYDARVAADAEVSIGRTNSKRGLGFMVTIGKGEPVDFVLDRDQVAQLAAFLQDCALPGLRKPLGRKPRAGWSLLRSPKQRLHLRLEDAAMRAHPGWHFRSHNDIEQDAGAPAGRRLIAWFKKAHPKEAARIERVFTNELWAGLSAPIAARRRGGK
jgi:hypothetical protein